MAALLALFALITVIRSQDGDGTSGQDARAVAQTTPRRTQASEVRDAVRTPARTPAKTPTSGSPTSRPSPAADDSRCDELRRFPNWQPNDREWFLANCLAGGPVQAASGAILNVPVPTTAPAGVSPPAVPPVQPAVPTAVLPPTATPVPPPQDGAAIAISLAVQWLRNDAPVTFDARPSDCSAVSAGSAWIATCNSRLAGCGDQPSCVRSIGLCVVLQPPTVTSARSC
jgi:hypothetical protein